MSLVEPAVGRVPTEAGANGCFETLRAYQGKLFRLEGHLDRLYASAQFLGTRAPADRAALRRTLTEALERSRIREAVVRVALIPVPGQEARPHVVVRPVPLPLASAYRTGIKVATVPARKFSVASITPQAKYSARMGSVMAVQDAILRRMDEALFLDASGSVTESTASNFAVVRRGAVQTPPMWLGLLAGITRDVLEEITGELGLRFEQIPLTRHDVYNADEAFMTSTLKEVLAVTWVDGRRIGTGKPGPVTQRLLRAFRALVRRELGLR
jgi:branched-chain amino acid aminotransferase